MKEEKNTIRVVYCEPGRIARITEIETGLDAMQRVVGGGYIEACYPFEEEVCIVCNDEGKFNGMRPCRAVHDENGKVQDIIFGPFFICDCRGEDFASLSDEQARKYMEIFLLPETYMRMGTEIVAVPYEPKDAGIPAR